MKKLDLNYFEDEGCKCEGREILFCIQAWHEMLNPGHHHIVLHSDGSGRVVAAPNYPPMGHIPLDARKPLLEFWSLQDFIEKTMDALKKDGWEVVDSREVKSYQI